MANNILIFLIVAIGGIGSVLTEAAFAQDVDNSYSHQHITSTWNNDLVCGNHICAPGELPQNPQIVVPVRGH